MKAGDAIRLCRHGSDPVEHALNAFLGKSIGEICPAGFGRTRDNHSHCAHFVGHALELAFGTTCIDMFHSEILDQRGVANRRGASIRVNELYRELERRCLRNDFGYSDSGLIFVTLRENINAGRNLIEITLRNM